MGPKFSAPVLYKDEDLEELEEIAMAIAKANAEKYKIIEVKEQIRNHVRIYKEDRDRIRTEVREFFVRTTKDTTKFLKDNQDIVTTQADKGNVAIVMYKEEYKKKVYDLLEDRSTYEELTERPDPGKYRNSNISLLYMLMNSEHLGKEQINQAIREENKIANMYALVKKHKEGMPGRPVVNTRATPGYLIAKTITKILKTGKLERGQGYDVGNSYDVVDRLKETIILPSERLFSIDVKAMYTSIPVHEAIKSIIKKKGKFDTKLTINQIVRMIGFVCCTNADIEFNGRFFKQIRGLKMGSAVSGILADFVMDDMLDRCFREIERPTLLVKYVDDMLGVAKNDHRDKIIEILNSLKKGIIFEVEEETEGKINYLDITVHNKKNLKLETTWYQKSIASGRFLNFWSDHPTNTIIHTAVTFIENMLRLIEIDRRQEMIEKAKFLLKINSFPEEIIKDIIEKTEELVKGLKGKRKRNKVNKITKSVNYIPGVTKKITDTIKKAEKEKEKGILIPVRPTKNNGKIYNKYKRFKPDK